VFKKVVSIVKTSPISIVKNAWKKKQKNSSLFLLGYFTYKSQERSCLKEYIFSLSMPFPKKMSYIAMATNPKNSQRRITKFNSNSLACAMGTLREDIVDC